MIYYACLLEFGKIFEPKICINVVCNYHIISVPISMNSNLIIKELNQCIEFM